MPSRYSISIRARLLDTARRLRDSGELPTGRKIGGRADFFSAVQTTRSIRRPDGSRPACRPRSTPARNLRRPQFCMDAGVVRRYMARLAECGIAERLSVIIGVVPLRSARVGALDQGEAVRRRDSGRPHRSHGARQRSGGGRPPHLRRYRAGTGEASHTSPAFTSWRPETMPWCSRSSRRRAPASSGSRLPDGSAQRGLHSVWRKRHAPRIRTPVASNIALAIAAATGLIDGSPAPVGARSGWLISTTLHFGRRLRDIEDRISQPVDAASPICGQRRLPPRAFGSRPARCCLRCISPVRPD